MNIDVVIVIKMAEPPGKERRENKNNQHVNRRHDDTRLENLHVFPTRAYKFENFHAHLVSFKADEDDRRICLYRVKGNSPSQASFVTTCWLRIQVKSRRWFNVLLL